MSKTNNNNNIIRVNEYYDLFDVKDVNGTITENLNELPNNIKPNNTYNTFRGFNNFPITDTSSSIQPYNANNSQYQEIAGQHKSPQANSSIRIEDNGDIWCYPPNVSVPYWSRIIFRNFDYTIKPASSSYTNILAIDYPFNLDTDNFDFNINGSLADSDTSDNKYDFSNAELESTGTNLTGSIMDFREGNIFLRFDEYPSRSKVIFSKCDKTRNPDIEFNFNYHKGQIEPIKLNISLSANIPLLDYTNGDKYNHNLNKTQLGIILKSCYWCIEWICDKDAGN